ncbi:MAG: hypothetical protein QOE58_624 [Actinomycetota bacterium]|nr:hypothetical protein [Actinomycetota bacterium]
MDRTTRSRATSAVAGVLLAAASTGIAATDAHTRPANHGRNPPAVVAPGGDVGSTESAVSCGVERWGVKTGTDAGAARVDLTSVKRATVAELDALPPPVDPIARVTPVEDTVFEVSATLTFYKTEADSDYHLVLSDDLGHTMIAEIPLPDCVSSGPFKAAIGSARAALAATLHSSTRGRTVTVPVTVQGVGFFDHIHGQRGVAPNGIELHPVLAISFGNELS